MIFITILLVASAKPMTFSGLGNSITQELSSHIIKRAYLHIDIDTKFMFLPGDRALLHANSGVVDGEISRIKRISQKFTNLLLVPVKINSIEAGFFTKDSRIHIEKWEDLKNYRFVIVQGSKFIEKKTKKFHPFVTKSHKIAFDMLAANRTDIIVVSKLTGLFYLSKNLYPDIKPLNVSLIKLPLYHFIHKKNKKLLPQITKAFQDMASKGEIQKIYDSFIKFR